MSHEYESFDHAGFRIRIVQDDSPEEPDYGGDDFFIIQGSFGRWRMGREDRHADPSSHLPWGVGQWGEWNDLLKEAGVEVPPAAWDTTGDDDEQECSSVYAEWEEEYDPSYRVWPLSYGDAHGPGTGSFTVINFDDLERRTVHFWAFVRVPATELEKLAASGEPSPEAVRDGMLETYTQWTNGDVWGFIIEKVSGCETCGQENAEEMDSCWGYYGTDACIEAAKESAEHLEGEAA